MNETRRLILQRILIDIVSLGAVGLPLLYYNFWVDAKKRGFYCDDQSIKNPYMESTVRSWMLYVIGLGLPFIVIFVVEFSIFKQTNNKTNRIEFFGFKIPTWLFECYEKLGTFAFGMTSCQLVIDFAKYSIGRLRPHFLDVCQPILADGTTCDNPQNFGKYIEDFSCRGENFTARLLKETRLSFPSGHSSFTFYIMIYLVIYLQKRLKLCSRSGLLCLTLQFSFIAMAIFTAASRVFDFKHHWEDVTVGAIIGILSAVLVSYKLPRQLYNWRSVLGNSPNKLN